MNYYIIPAALIVTLIVTFLFSIFSKKTMRELWIFFLLIFLATWAGQLWILPFGPITRGISWLSLVFVAVFFAVFILALMPMVPADTKPEKSSEEGAFMALGAFLWIILIILLISIALGYYRMPGILAT